MPDQPLLSNLFTRIANGEAIAFEDVYNLYYDRIYQVAFVYSTRIDLAEDTAQQVFMKLWERRTELLQIENPEGWLFRAAKYQVWKMLEREATKDNYRQQVLQTIAESAASPADILSQKEKREIIETAINSLSAKQREVYLMVREQGLGYEAVAAQLGIGRETVKDHMAKALKKIREHLSQHKDRLIGLFIFLNYFF